MLIPLPLEADKFGPNEEVAVNPANISHVQRVGNHIMVVFYQTIQVYSNLDGQIKTLHNILLENTDVTKFTIWLRRKLD